MAFRVTLPNIHAQVITTENEKYIPILNLLKVKKEITRSDVENSLKIGTTYSITLLKAMLENGLITKLGNGKQTRFILNS